MLPFYFKNGEESMCRREGGFSQGEERKEGKGGEGAWPGNLNLLVTSERKTGQLAEGERQEEEGRRLAPS